VKNAFTTDHLWSPEQLRAWVEMPKGMHGWTAPATEQYRQQWKEWWGKWGKTYPYTPISEGYKRLDAQKAKNLSKESTVDD
jgi:hypothetical protein